MAIDKLTPRYLNFEDDERLVKRIEMTDAVNIRIDSDDDGDAGVIKNVVGNTQVSLLGDTLPAGNNKVIGSVHNNVKGEILFFVHNSGNNHRIYKYDDNLEKVITVYKNEATGAVASASADTLGFKATDYVDAAVLVDKDGDTLLYFTNGRGEPKKINVDKAIRGDYPDGYEGVEAYISLIKKPPLEAPTYQFNSNEKLKVNRLLGRQFQFACQYVYDDGEVSAISPISKVTKTYSHIQVGFISPLDLNNIDNEIEITCKTTNSDISKVRFLAREGNDGVFFIVEDVPTSFSTAETTLSVNFSNEKAYKPISNNENNKQFDSVGEDVKSITISGNRIFLGNYTEGFDLPDLSENVGVKMLVNYHPKPPLDDLQGLDSTASYVTNGMFNAFRTESGGSHDNGTATYTRGKVSHHTILDFSNIENEDFNSYTKFTLSLNFTDINAAFLSNFKVADVPSGSIEFDGSTSLQGLQQKVGDIFTSFTVDLDSGNYTSYLEVVDDIIDKINNLQEFSVSCNAAPPNVIEGNVYSGTIKVKLRAKRNISSLPQGVYSNEIVGVSKVVLFLEPKSVALDVQVNDGIYTWVKKINKNFTSPLLSDDSGFGIMDDISNDGVNILVPPTDSCIFQNASFKSEGFFTDDTKVSSFKAGANHALGVVYQDKNGRLSTVQPVNNVNVEWFDSSARKGNGGRSSVVMRIPSSVDAPENAVRWFPVYAGNTSVSNFLQYTVNDAFVPDATADSTVPSEDDVEDKLYISARGLEGKESSYKEVYEPYISYSHASGDVMKIVSVDENRSFNDEFPVIDYKFLTSASAENPILGSTTVESQIFEKTGYFFVIRKNPLESTFISEASTATGNAWKNKCLVEIRTPKYSSDNQVYYQIGESYPISNRKHQGFDRATALTSPTVNGSNGSYTIVSSTRAYVGDVFDVSTLGTVEVENVFARGTEYVISGSSIAQTTLTDATSLTVELTSSQLNEAVVEIDDGDVYFRRRHLKYGYLTSTKNNLLDYTDFVEDYRMNDFISKASNDFGKPNAFSEEASRIHRNSSITYSDAHVMDSDRLSLSSFNNSLANFLDIKNKYGAIQRMMDIEDAFYAVQEHKVTLFPVNRNVLQSAAGDATVTLSTDVVNLNSSKSFAGDYGCGNDPEAVVYYEGVLYFVDRKANKVFSISSSGIREISDIFADSYIADKLEKADKGGEYNIYSGIDPNNDEYLLSTRTIVNKTITVGVSQYVLPANSGDSVLSDFTPHSVNSTTFGNFNLLNFNFEDVDVNFEDMGNGVLYVDDGFSDNAMELDTPVDNLTSGTSNIVYTDKGNTFLGVAQVDNTNKFVELDPS